MRGNRGWGAVDSQRQKARSRKFIEEGLEQCRREKAIELYVDEKGSLKDASEITGVTVRMTMRTLIKKNIPLRMDEGIFDRGMEHAREVFGIRLG